MSKKVLVISSSPRKGGNSDTLCDEFARGAAEAGHQVEKIFLKDKKINYCTGCGFCMTNDHNGCSQKDDMTEVLEKIIAADTLVLASPAYFYTMCAQLKTMIDRCCAKYTKITNKELYFIATAGDDAKPAVDRIFEEFRGYLYCLEDSVEKGAIRAVGVMHKDDVKKTGFMAEAYEMGKSV